MTTPKTEGPFDLPADVTDLEIEREQRYQDAMNRMERAVRVDNELPADATKPEIEREQMLRDAAKRVAHDFRVANQREMSPREYSFIAPTVHAGRPGTLNRQMHDIIHKHIAETAGKDHASFDSRQYLIRAGFMDGVFAERDQAANARKQSEPSKALALAIGGLMFIGGSVVFGVSMAVAVKLWGMW